MSLSITRFHEDDWPEVWHIIEPVFAAGETFPTSPDISETDAFVYWVDTPVATYVARAEDGEIAGGYYIRVNQPTLGDHVCNCGYVVAEKMRGRGLAEQLCRHSQDEARKLGFQAMQYNLVVASNEAAIKAWTRCGMEIIGTLPKAFRHQELGLVDAHIMYRWLGPAE